MSTNSKGNWKSNTVSKIRNDTPDRLVAEAFHPRFKRYLHRPCVVAWLRRAEAFLTTHPQVGEAMALRAPELVARASRERGLCEPELELRAWTVRACMLKVLGDLAPAEDAFQRALNLGQALDDSPDLAAAWAGYSLLKSIQGQHTKALDLVDRALARLRSSSDPRVGTCDRLSIPCFLVVRGIVLTFSGASVKDVEHCYVEALRTATKQTPLSKQTASQNLAEAFVRGLMEGEPVEVDALLNWCGSLHRQLESHGERLSSPSRCRLRWVEALALAWRAGLTEQAERYFASARTSLLRLGAKQDVVLLDLDRAYWLCRERQWAKLQTLARRTWQLANAAGYRAEALVALQQWHTALENRTGELPAFREVYRVVRGLSAPFLSPSPRARSSRWPSDLGW